MEPTGLFSSPLPETIRNLVTQHHTIYPRVPPQGIYFEALAERAFDLCGAPGAHIAQNAPNQPEHDLIVGESRVSLKTETGKGTKERRIQITKLCTTERDPWEASNLVERAMAHLSRYDTILMLRAVWSQEGDRIRYQLIEIPVPLLKRMGEVEFAAVGRRASRRSIGGDCVDEDGDLLFHIHFDGSDGKCQIRNLDLDRCTQLMTWEQRLTG